MTTHTLTRSMLAAMIGAALALGTVASGEARAAQGHAQNQHDEDDAKAKAKAKQAREERAERRQAAPIRGHAAVDARIDTNRTAVRADVSANERQRARVAATVDRNQRAERMQAQARADAEMRARMERQQRAERAQAQARANARLQAQARLDNRNDRDDRNDRGDERYRRVPPGQIVSAEAHRRNAERKAAHDLNRRDDWRDGRREAIERERIRVARYNGIQAERQRLARQRAIDLQRANRLAQYRYQQQYYDRLRQLQLRDARYDWNRDPYFTTAPMYRYQRAGNYYQVNNYAADMLREAVRLGYQQGVRAGQADRYDGWRPSYRDSFVYQDASLGYRGYYVDRDEYEHYFREGFRRGYEDGYYQRSQYGRYDNSNANILGTVLSLILNFQDL